jgi:2-keto-myo-inositol isomerase
MAIHFDRRELLMCGGGVIGAALTAGAVQAAPASAAAPSAADPFHYCLNTSTIRGQKLGIVAEIQLASEAGYHAIEPWMRELNDYVQAGGSLPDLARRLRDANLTVESAIGFAPWIVDDEVQRAQGLEEAKRDMALLSEIGGKRLAAPPVGATKEPGPPLLVIADRYRALLELGARMGIVPQVEVWGHSRTLSRLGESVCVAVESRHPQACILPDIYHLHRGGSDFHGLNLLSGAAVHVFHVNDYPAEPPTAQLTDAHRVYPGDGVAPLGQIFRTLRDNGFRGHLSLELFNRDYWNQDAALVARTGLEKTRAAVAAALSL